MIRKLSLAVITAIICAAMTTAALASQTGQNTVSVEESAGNSGQKIVTVESAEDPAEVKDGQKIVTVEPSEDIDGQKIFEIGSSEDKDGQIIVEVGGGQNGQVGQHGQSGQNEKAKQSDHKIVTVSGGDTYSVEGEGKSPRMSYEEYGGYSFWGFSDEYDDSYYDGYENSQPYGTVSQQDAAVPGIVASGSQAVGYYDDNSGYYNENGYYNDNSGYNGGYYDGYYDGYVDERGGGASGILVFVALAIGAIVGFTYYFSTKSSYENAGIGVVYDLKENAVLKLGNTRDSSSGVVDRQIETRSHVDRGYYGRSTGQIQSGQHSGGVISPNMQNGRPQQMNTVPRPPQMPGGMRPPKR